MAIREFDFEREPTVSIVKKILTDAIKMKVTDIHFDPHPDKLVIRFRNNGELSEYTNTPDNVKLNIITRVKIIAGMNITDSILPQTGVINLEVDGKSHSMQVSTLPVLDGEKVVVHISNYARNLKNIDRIGMEQEDIDKIKNLLREKQGVILVTGTNGSGKTTTTYALLKELNKPDTNIISIEDPIKMPLEGVNQVQVAPDKGVTYKTILRNIESQDLNVLAINELVDDETTRTALRLSTTGRLVISTLNTKTVSQTVDTLLNMNVENYLLGDNLIGIISQRLVKKLCPNCRVKKEASEYEKTVIQKITGQTVKEIYYPEGCEECKEGYLGQSPISEVVPITPELRDAISNNRNRQLIRNIIYADNDTILKDGFKKVLSGETSFSEIIRITDIKTDFSPDEENIKQYILGKGEKPLEETNVVPKNVEEPTPTKEPKEEPIEEHPEEDKVLKNDLLRKMNEDLTKIKNKAAEEKTEEPTPTEPTPEPKEEPKPEPITEEPQLVKDEPTEEEKQEPIEEVKEVKDEDVDLFNKLNLDDDDDDDFSYGDEYSII
ncbi:MAG: type II/IV secretion system protein [Bacilli bacterium]|nr:type II/IV secretion system protein [Bacilli bacterium]